MTQIFKKTLKQKLAILLLTGAAKFLMLFGGSRSGKTFILVYAVLVRAAKVKSRHAILRLKFNHAKRSIFLDTLPKVLTLCFPDMPVNWNKSDLYITLPNGSEVWIGGLDDKERVEKILGNEYSTLYFNESSQIPASSIRMALTRLAEKNSLKKKAYFDMNPPSKKHWSYWWFIKHYDTETEKDLDPANYASMVMNPEDNLDNIDEEYLSMLEALPEKERDRFLKGLFTDSDDGIAYYAFDPERHIKPTSKMPGTIYCGMDFNVAPMTATLFQVQNNRFVYLDEVWLMNSDTYKMCDELIRRGYRGATVIPDSTGKNRRTSGNSDFEILRSYGFTISYVTNPHVVDRINNQNRLFTADRIIIDPKCKKLRNDYEQVSWKNSKLDEGPEKLLTHISDCSSYGTWKLDPIGMDLSSYSVTKH